MKQQKERLAFLAEDSVQGFTAYCGMMPVSMEPGRFVTRIQLEGHHRQQDNYVHAGVIATMADHTAGYASYSLVPKNRRILTVEYKINFIAPAMGEVLECRAEVIKPGKSLLVAESEVYAVHKAEETLVAKALLTMAAVPIEKINKK